MVRTGEKREQPAFVQEAEALDNQMLETADRPLPRPPRFAERGRIKDNCICLWFL